MNPLTKLAALLTKTPLSQVTEGENPHRKVLVGIAYPLGAYLADEFDDLEDMFEFLEDEDILSSEQIKLLRNDKEFCEALEEGMNSGLYDDDDDEDDEYYPEYDEDYGESDEEDYHCDADSLLVSNARGQGL